MLGDSRAFWSMCALGFLVDYRLFNAFTMNRFLEEHLVTRGLVTVYRLGDIYAFHCNNEDYLLELVERSVASFDGALMVFSRWFPGVVPRTVRFARACIWVRVCVREYYDIR
ncbi:hypothetical protein RND81_01G070000 [Saponaria officinalis]|uniref:Uncharacterized protein n=1 Tax=Saponaria officinalis TaxID=3572 RepID=A0AAW1N909_SAPOF